MRMSDCIPVVDLDGDVPAEISGTIDGFALLHGNADIHCFNRSLGSEGWSYETILCVTNFLCMCKWANVLSAN